MNYHPYKETEKRQYYVLIPYQESFAALTLSFTSPASALLFLLGISLPRLFLIFRSLFACIVFHSVALYLSGVQA